LVRQCLDLSNYLRRLKSLAVVSVASTREQLWLSCRVV
jgi:hypothetical protein